MNDNIVYNKNILVKNLWNWLLKNLKNKVEFNNIFDWLKKDNTVPTVALIYQQP